MPTFLCLNIHLRRVVFVTEQSDSFKTKANEVKEALELRVTDIIVTVNPTKVCSVLMCIVCDNLFCILGETWPLEYFLVISLITLVVIYPQVD